MKRKVISIIGLALFVGAIIFNIQMTSPKSENNKLTVNNVESVAGTVTLEAFCAQPGDCGLSGIESDELEIWP